MNTGRISDTYVECKEARKTRKMEETKDDVIKEESEYESNVDNQSIVTDSFVDEKIRYRDEFEDYTSLAFERDLEVHTRSLKKLDKNKSCPKCLGNSPCCQLFHEFCLLL